MASGQNKSSLTGLLEIWTSYLSDGRAVSFGAFSVITPPSLFFGFLTYGGRTDNPAWLEATAIVLSHFGLYLGMLLGKKAILGKGTKPSALRILLLYSFASQVSGFILISLLKLPFSANQGGISAWVVCVFGLFVAVAWLTISHLVVSLWLQNFRMIRDLKTKTLQLEEVRSNVQGELSAQLRQLREVVAEKVDRVLEGIQTQVRSLSIDSSPRDFLSSAMRVRGLANQEVRELSHQIAASDFSEAGLQAIRPDWWQTWREALKTSGDTQLYWPWVAGIGSVNAISLAMQRNGLPDVLTFVFGLAVGIVSLRALDLIREPLFAKASDLTKTISVLAVYLIASVSVTWLLHQGAYFVPEAKEFTSLMMVSVPVAIIFLWLMVFLIRGFVNNSRLRAIELVEQSRLLEQEIDRARTATHATREKMSRVLHGTVQGRLASVSLALTASSEASNRDTANELLIKAKEQLDLTRDDLNTALWNLNEEDDVNVQLEDLIASWHSILDVDFNISQCAAEILNSRQDIGTHVLTAHREAITNAARHSSSKSISIQIDVEPQPNPERVILLAENEISSNHVFQEPGIGISSLKNYAEDVSFQIVDKKAVLKVTWLISKFEDTKVASQQNL